MHRIVVGILVGILMLTLAPIASAVTDKQFNALTRKVNALQRQLNALHREVDDGFECLDEVAPFFLSGGTPTEGYVYVVGPDIFSRSAFDLDPAPDQSTYWVQLADEDCIENARIVIKPSKAAAKLVKVASRPDLLRHFARGVRTF